MIYPSPFLRTTASFPFEMMALIMDQAFSSILSPTLNPPVCFFAYIFPMYAFSKCYTPTRRTSTYGLSFCHVILIDHMCFISCNWIYLKIISVKTFRFSLFPNNGKPIIIFVRLKNARTTFACETNIVVFHSINNYFHPSFNSLSMMFRYVCAWSLTAGAKNGCAGLPAVQCQFPLSS